MGEWVIEAGVGVEPKMLQKRRVSSAEAETMVAPSGDCEWV